MIKSQHKAIIQYRDLLWNLVSRNLTVRYKRSAIGFLWTMLNPIIMTVVYAIVFATIFRFGTQDFVIYFLSGFLVWNFFAQSTADASQCIISSGSLIKKVYVPKEVFVLSTVISNLINMAFAMIPLMVLIFVLGKGINLSIIFLLPVMVLVTVFTLGISLTIASMTVFFHDIGEIYRVLLTPWMFLTPIIYPMNIIPEHYAPFFKFNPMYHFVECFRAPLYTGVAPEYSMMVVSAIFAGFSLLIGYYMFKRSEDSFIYHV